MTSSLVGLPLLFLLLLAWLGVQLRWSAAFSPEGEEGDALAGRLGCGGGCAGCDGTRCASDAGSEPNDGETS